MNVHVDASRDLDSESVEQAVPDSRQSVFGFVHHRLRSRQQIVGGLVRLIYRRRSEIAPPTHCPADPVSNPVATSLQILATDAPVVP